MVKVVEKSVCRGVAGRLSSTKGVMIHNTADNQSAEQHADRLKGYTNKQLENGFAHYYADHETIWRTEDTYNATYHAGNSVGNYNYISFEVVGDTKTDKAKFLQAEQNVFWQAAIDLKFHKLPVNRNTVRLHCELDVGTYTECPKRSLIEHAGWNSTQRQPQDVINKLKDYYIKEIKKYYDDPKLTPDKQEDKPVAKVNDRPTHSIYTGNFEVDSRGYKKTKEFLTANKWNFKEEVQKDGRVRFRTGRFNQNSAGKFRLEKWLAENNYSYVVNIMV